MSPLRKPLSVRCSRLLSLACSQDRRSRACISEGMHFHLPDQNTEDVREREAWPMPPEAERSGLQDARLRMPLYPVLHDRLASLWNSLSTLAGLLGSQQVCVRWGDSGPSWECSPLICLSFHLFPGINLGRAGLASLPGSPCRSVQGAQGRLWPQSRF